MALTKSVCDTNIILKKRRSLLLWLHSESHFHSKNDMVCYFIGVYDALPIGSLENLRARGVLIFKGQFLKECMNLNWNFQRGGVQTIKSSLGTIWIISGI